MKCDANCQVAERNECFRAVWDGKCTRSLERENTQLDTSRKGKMKGSTEITSYFTTNRFGTIAAFSHSIVGLQDLEFIGQYLLFYPCIYGRGIALMHLSEPFHRSNSPVPFTEQRHYLPPTIIKITGCTSYSYTAKIQQKSM